MNQEIARRNRTARSNADVELGRVQASVERGVNAGSPIAERSGKLQMTTGIDRVRVAADGGANRLYYLLQSTHSHLRDQAVSSPNYCFSHRV
jgi:hypothetical protein